MKERIYSYDVLRVLAIIAVVAIHSVTPLILAFGKLNTPSWMIANLVDSASRASVPLFIMISGALLLSKKDAPLNLWKKRLLRIGYPLLFWTIIYAYYYHFFRGDPLSIERVLHRVINDQPYEHLYFLYIILFLSFFTPFFTFLLTRFRSHLLILLLTLILCIYIGENRFILLFWIPYSAYYLGGFIVSKIPFHKPTRFLLLYLVSVAFIACGTYLLYSQKIANSQSLYLYEYVSPFVITASFSFFLYITRIPLFLFEKQKTTITLLASYSFGIYLIHPLIQDLIEKFLLPNTTLFSAFLTFLLVFSLSVVATHLFKQLPGFKSFV